ncbi:MAG: hypothetical protein A2X86_01205 [Bdellovibrionales bacterium GWA2_49_15]|nr:MAG: hypothetical protein A2X86_01205 [Bdellovibrionales bacterium GWA2_49_15]HAZ12158.1 hypothetical protein [Bdellovibrionales bacterium]
MRLCTLSLVTFFIATNLSPGTAFAQKYHSANDTDVEFSLEEKNNGPQPYYIDKEAIEKARKAQYASEKKEAIWYAKRLAKFLDRYRAQQVAQQNRAVAERTFIAQQSMELVSDEAKSLLAGNANQARALIARAQYQEAALAQAAKNAPAQGTEVSRTLASLDRPVFKIFKHQPKRPQALSLWAKMGKKLAHKAQQAAIKRRAAIVGVVATVPSSLPLGMQATKAIKADRRPASLGTLPARPEGVWQGVARKLTGAYNNLKSKLFNW